MKRPRLGVNIDHVATMSGYAFLGIGYFGNVDQTNPFGIVQWDTNYNVTSFNEKPLLNHYIGYFVFQKALLDSLPQDIIDMPDGSGLIRMFEIMIGMREILG